MKWKCILAACLAVPVCFGAFSGCSGKIDKPENSSATVSGKTEEHTSPGVLLVEAAKKNSNFNATGKKIVNEKTSFDIWVAQTSSQKKAEDRECTKRAETDTNVHINYIEIPSSSWNEKVNISLSSDTLPDAYAGGIPSLSSYVNRFQPLNELIQEYSPAVQEMFQELPQLKVSLADYSGIIRGLPIGDAYLGNTRAGQLWINQEWLRNIGMSMPTTTDEFESVLKAFREKDPNKNGKQDEIPFTFRNVWDWGSGCGDMFGPFGTVESAGHVFVDSKDKTLRFAPQEKGYYKALQWLHKLYSEGLIANTVFTMSDDMYCTQNTGKDVVGVYVGYGDDALGNDDLASTWFTDPKSSNLSKLFGHIPPLKGPDGTQMVFQDNLNVSPSFLITNKCKAPEILVRWYDYINTGLENFALWRQGKENEVWHWGTVDQAKMDSYRKLHPDLQKNLLPIKVGDKVPSLYNTDDWPQTKWKDLGYTDVFEYNSAESFGGQSISYDRAGIISDAQISEWASTLPDTKILATIKDIPYAVQGLPAGMATKENAEKRAKISADLDTYLLRFISDSVMNGIDDAKWNTHLSKLKAIKGNEYLKLCQEAYEALNSTMAKNSESTIASK